MTERIVAGGFVCNDESMSLTFSLLNATERSSSSRDFSVRRTESKECLSLIIAFEMHACLREPEADKAI